MRSTGNATYEQLEDRLLCALAAIKRQASEQVELTARCRSLERELGYARDALRPHSLVQSWVEAPVMSMAEVLQEVRLPLTGEVRVEPGPGGYGYRVTGRCPGADHHLPGWGFYSRFPVESSKSVQQAALIDMLKASIKDLLQQTD